MAQFWKNGFVFSAFQVIRLFDHPFIPLFFHWRTCVIRANHEKAGFPAVLINPCCARKNRIPAHEMKAISIQRDPFPVCERNGMV